MQVSLYLRKSIRSAFSAFQRIQQIKISPFGAAQIICRSTTHFVGKSAHHFASKLWSQLESRTVEGVSSQQQPLPPLTSAHQQIHRPNIKFKPNTFPSQSRPSPLYCCQPSSHLTSFTNRGKMGKRCNDSSSPGNFWCEDNGWEIVRASRIVCV